jgi:hypothetical protein
MLQNSVHWDQNLLSRATLLPDHVCHSCNICSFGVGYTSTQHSIPYTRISHFPSYFCFFLPTCFSDLYGLIFFLPPLSLFIQTFVSFYFQYSFFLCISIPTVPEGQFKKERYVSDRTHTFSLTYVFSFFFSLLSPFIRISSHVLN